MTYEPLHHKYRPQTFGELVGQEAIATTLSNALRQQRIAPAYLFTGARGTGKTSSARIFAKSLNCIASDRPTDTPCGVCEVCRAIAGGSALDVIEIDAASNTGVDNIRELIERAQFAPVQCRYKVYVIDEVHMLSTAAFNALLKTLEEPPDRVVIVLATTDPQKVLPTIISRCQKFDFRRIPLGAMVDHLGAIAQKEGISIANEATQLVAQISQGGLRDAESLLDQLSLLDGEITTERVWDLVGAVPERDLIALLHAIAQDDPSTVLDHARHLMDRGREPLIVLQNLAGFYRDLLIAKTAPARSDLVAITPGTWAELCQFAAQADISWITAGQQHLRVSEVQVKNTTQPRLWLEVTLLGLLPSAVQATAQSAGPSAAPRAATSPPARPAPAATPAHPEPAAAPSPSNAPPRPAPTPAIATNIAANTATNIAADSAADYAEPRAASPPPSPNGAQPPAPSPADDLAEAGPPEDIPVEAASVAPPTASGDSDAATDLHQLWQDILSLVQPFSTQTMLRQQCHLIAYNGHEARVGTKSQPLFRMAKDRMPNIEAAFAQYFSRTIRVSLEVVAVADSPPETPSNHSAGPPSQPGPPRPKSIPSQISRPAPSPSPPAAASPPSSPSPSAAVPAPRAASPAASPAPTAVPSAGVPSAAPPAASVPITAAPITNTPEQPIPGEQIFWSGEDEVVQAAKSFAQMFNGQIVDLDGSLASSASSGGILSGAIAEVDEDDDDVPF
ncbi:MAG TPA: DNA polymerase III subunit gamma/tau [Chroococcidiopsis sp.]